ncbi:uncharacterized protein LOC127878815 [Dreissena polymorpha]|uniref:uncharacterized protein LOC127878815 n=1 Tax=Dreissena polymorpha TaxID=45954 RepID=UPI002263C0F5|nr:uncharacterized protein LOC127878815 [Dreissena polymorpha]
MLKNIWLNNFVVFDKEESFDFQSQHGPYIFIGENGSGKSAVFEGIRRCLKADLNTSVSRPFNPNEVSYFMCIFQIDEKKDMISGTLCIPTNKAVQKVDPCGTKYKPLETNSLDYYQFAIEHEEKKVIRVYVDFLKLPTTNESKAGIQTHQVTLNDSEGKVLKDLSASNVVSLLMHILNYENISIERDHKSSTHCQMLLMEFSTKLVFTFPLRSIGPLQWSESHRIKGEERAKNYKKAEKRCEIIKTFLTDENNAKFDKEKEKRIFQMITSMSDEYKYNFTLDEGQDGILVNQDNFTLLKTPEGILEAKYVSILLSGKCYKTILLEEPDRGMHPQFVKRMTQAIKQEVETKGTMVLLTTHNTAFLTPSTLSNCYQFSRVSNACTVIAVRKIGIRKWK